MATEWRAMANLPPTRRCDQSHTTGAYPVGSETQIRSRGESVVLVDQAAEQVTSPNVSRAHRQRSLVFGHGRRKGESAMGPAAVVMLGIRACE